jgi:uncharacterized protein (TIGR02145 family)
MSIDYFEWNTLVPDPSLSSTNSSTTWDTNADPCSKVSSTRTWRTPTAEEFNVLKAMYTATPSLSSWDDTKKGLWFGDTQNTGNTSVYLFLPAAGNSSTVGSKGYYWSSTPLSGRNYVGFLYFYDTNLYVNYGDYHNSGFSVRCVSDSKIGTPNNVDTAPGIDDENEGNLNQII